jgi:hypothetical protein
VLAQLHRGNLFTMTRRSDAAALVRRPSTDLRPEDAVARPPGGDLRWEELTPEEQMLGTPGATREQADAALQALGRRALASPEGYVAVRAFDPDDLDDDS